MIKSFREFLSESKDYIKQIKDQIKKAKKDFPKSEFDQEKQVIAFIKKLPKNIELDVKDPKLQKLGYNQTPYIHVGNGNFETKVNGKFNSVTADKIYSFLNEDALNEGNHANSDQLSAKIDDYIKNNAKLDVWFRIYSDPKKHKLDFINAFDDLSLDMKSLTLIKYFINLGNQLDSSIGLHCLKHYQESGMLKKYPKDVCENAVTLMEVMKYDPDVFFDDMSLTNSEAVAFFKKKGFKF